MGTEAELAFQECANDTSPKGLQRDRDDGAGDDDNENICIRDLEGEVETNIMSMPVDNVQVDSPDEVSDIELSFMDKHVAPPLLCRHPPPESGRDDDFYKLKDILDKFLIDTGHIETSQCYDRIILAPDYKTAKNVFKLMNTSPRYQIFLPEFPLLHLRKSKIGNFLKAYKSAGLLQILNYMRDEDTEKDWSKLVTVSNIDKATRIIRRLSVALHVAFILKFMETLQVSKATELLEQLCAGDKNCLEKMWQLQYQAFVGKGCKDNATFCQHHDMMMHADEIVAIITAERSGGPGGYSLLLAAVKNSLPFSFINAATSYAQFCLQLVHEHYGAGTFHRHLKEALFTTPHNHGETLFALDTQREIDHRHALKAFRRSSSSLSSILPRMACVDHLEEIHVLRTSLGREFEDGKPASLDESRTTTKGTLSDDSCHLGKRLTENDLAHISRTAKVILKRDGLSLKPDATACNVYSKEIITMPISILDKISTPSAHFLMTRFVAKENMFEMTNDDIPSIDNVTGPKSLLGKVKRSKGVTINRISSSQVQVILKPTDKKGRR